ncbi:MAG: DinB family protein [Caldilineaceae bacterium]
MKDQFFTDYLERLTDLQQRLYRDVRDLPPAAMDWSPGPQMNPKMNTVAVLLAHIIGVLHEGIDLALDEPPSRVRAQEFQTQGLSSAEMLQRLDRVIDYARDALPRLDLAELSQARTDEDGPITCGWALLHALEHAYLHLGHLQLTCQLWRQRET